MKLFVKQHTKVNPIELELDASQKDVFGNTWLETKNEFHPVRAKDRKGELDTILYLGFSPVGKWEIRAAGMEGSKYVVDFFADGMFEMLQYVADSSVPIQGSWSFDDDTKYLSMQGVINTFQPFIFSIQVTGKLPQGYAGVGADSLSYRLTRVRGEAE